MQTDDLDAAYQRFVAEVAAGGFGAPPAGEWSAQQLAAHVALNDALLAEAIEQVLAGRDARFDNSTAVDWPKVTAFADEHGGLAGTIEALRASSARLCAVAGRLADPQAAAEIAVHIVDGVEVAVDRPMPIGRLLAIQASFHLPAHTDQLRALRPA